MCGCRLAALAVLLALARSLRLVAATPTPGGCSLLPCRSLDVPLFPTVQRHRYFRIKQRLPGAAAQAARLALLGFALAAGVALARARTSGAALVAPLSLGSALVALLAGSLCAFCWLMAGATLEVVFTERLRPDDYSERDVLAAMAASLAGRRGDVMQGLALHDARWLGLGFWGAWGALGGAGSFRQSCRSPARSARGRINM